MIQTNHRAALYARFSSDNQRSESIDAQIRAMKAYCKQRSIVIVDIYTDEARSATTDRRPSFQRMIHDSHDHIFDIVLVHKLDRFARNRYDSAVYKRELRKNGVIVYSVLENLDDSPESIMMESVLEGMSEYYSQNLAREVMKGMKETALQCKHTGGKPPLGYDVDSVTKKLMINPREAEAVRLIFQMYSEGCGYSAILAALHCSGYVTKGGGEFLKNSLYGVLTNPKYKGLYVFNRSSAKNITGTRNTHLLKNEESIITIDGGCPQIVDTAIYDKVQERLTEHKHTGGRKNAKTSYLLSGKVRCMECGKAMVGNKRCSGRNSIPYITYRCPSQKYRCCNKEINRDYLERYTIELLENSVFNARALKEIMHRINTYRVTGKQEREKEANGLLTRLCDIEQAIQNVTDAVAAGLVSPALAEKLSALEKEKAETEAKIGRHSIQENVETVPIDPKVILEEYERLKKAPASPEYKAFLQNYVGRIEVGKYSVDITLKTGLDLFQALDTTMTVRRQAIYAQKKQPS